jgi:LPXTG-site transpeptidase (sortase) family protein
MALVDSLGYDIDRLPTPKKRNRSVVATLIIDIFTVIFFSICVFAFINYPALSLIGLYKLSPHKIAFEFPTHNEVTSQAAVVVAEKKPAESKGIKQYPDNTVFIPKIGVQAAIGWDTKNNEVMDALEKNVVHLMGTSKPGGSGNIFLTGHSSNYWWKEGEYNSVFALLPQLSEGDEIIITYRGEFHRYKVSGKEEMKKDEVEDHLEASQEKLTIMTCVPVGTNLKRLLIYADPVKAN